MSNRFYDWVSVKQRNSMAGSKRAFGLLIVGLLLLSAVTIGHAARVISFEEWSFEYHDCDPDNPFFQYDKGTCNPGLLLRAEIYLTFHGWLND